MKRKNNQKLKMSYYSILKCEVFLYHIDFSRITEFSEHLFSGTPGTFGICNKTKF